MTNNSKEAERAELHKTIWRIANDLRGSVDGWDFKTYVLGMLFYRFISENLSTIPIQSNSGRASPMAAWSAPSILASATSCCHGPPWRCQLKYIDCPQAYCCA